MPVIVFAHAAYRLGDEFSRRRPTAPFREARTVDDLRAAMPEAEVLVVSGLWRNDLLPLAPHLRLIQSVSAGTDQFDRAAITAKGVRLASARGANERAVAEHALALLLALTRHIPQAISDQASAFWRGMIGDPAARQDELAGKTMVVIGLGGIGSRIARLARAFEMRVIGVRRSEAPSDAVDRLVPLEHLDAALVEADVVVLACPLTSDTQGLIGAAQFRAMKPTAVLINVARGPVVDETALVEALVEGRISAAGLDVFAQEPLASSSPLWTLPNVLLTPHSAGETRRYEANVIDVLLDNLGHLARGEPLRNGIV